MPNYKKQYPIILETNKKDQKINRKMINRYGLDIAFKKALTKIFTNKLKNYYKLGLDHMI